MFRGSKKRERKKKKKDLSQSLYPEAVWEAKELGEESREQIDKAL